jgi:ABC-2 type transport system ATP-binding protein
MLAVQVVGITKAFGPVRALDAIELEVHRGEIFGLLGPNGAGKTTMVRILTTLVRPDSGHARVTGHDVFEEPDAVRRRIGYIPQEITVDPYLTCREHLEYYAGLYHLPTKTARLRASELLALVGLESDADRPVRRFSGGMKKKLDLICGLLHRPEVLFLDEPSLGLDVQVRREVWNHILRLKSEGVTIFLCTNAMDEADVLCDRLSILHRGRIAVTGSPRDLKGTIRQDSIAIDLPSAGHLDSCWSRLEPALKGLPFVGGVRLQDGRMIVSVESNEKALPKLLDVIHGVGVEVRSVAYSRPGLEEVFLQYTGTGYTEADPLPERP